MATLTALVLVAGCSTATPSPTAPKPPRTPAGASRSPTPAAQESNPAGDIPDSQQFVAYAVPGGAAQVKVPEGWARTDLPGGASFTDKLNTIRVQVRAGASAPTPATVRAEVTAENRTTAGFTALQLSTVTRTAGAAILARYQANSPVDPVTNKYVRDDVERYEFFRAGQVAVLTLSARTAPTTSTRGVRSPTPSAGHGDPRK